MQQKRGKRIEHHEKLNHNNEMRSFADRPKRSKKRTCREKEGGGEFSIRPPCSFAWGGGGEERLIDGGENDESVRFAPNEK